MAEVRFYHLTATPLEAALPAMLEVSLQRGWRAEVRGVDEARMRSLDALLWTWRDDAFLPHGLAGEAHAERQPVLLSTVGAGERANRAAVLFLVDGAPVAPDESAVLERTALLFDGHDAAAVEAARGEWRKVSAAGLRALYLAQEAGGRWVTRAESGTGG